VTAPPVYRLDQAAPRHAAAVDALPRDKYTRPKHTVFLLALPKTSVGKLDKLALKRM
jgi:non-ribosomal peptide synthetase component E (peptide arylation enzyme)